MRSLSLQSFIVLTLALNLYQICRSERRIAAEEWHQMRFGGFGGLPMATDPNQWTMTVPEMETDVVQQTNVQPPDTNTFQTNIQNVEVGRDKLVLVNDQGSIKMLRASQLPTMTKQNNDVPTTQTPPPTVIQMPLDQYLTKGSDQNPTKNPIQYINSNYGTGQLPVHYATTSGQPMYQQEANPCIKSSDSPPIYIPAPQVSASTARNDQKMVRIIIEMPESLTRNPDEASRYAASQVRRLKVPDEPTPKPRRKIRKNVHEVIRKVTQTEEEGPEENASSGVDEMIDEASNQSPDANNLIIANSGESSDTSGEKKYILIRKSGRLRGSRRQDNLKAVDKYKKVIKVYRN